MDVELFQGKHNMILFLCIYCAQFKCSLMDLCIEYLSHLVYIYTFTCFYTLRNTLNFVLVRGCFSDYVIQLGWSY